MPLLAQRLLEAQLQRIVVAQARLEALPHQHPQYHHLLTALVRERYRLARQLAVLEMVAALEEETDESESTPAPHGEAGTLTVEE